jgi:hypothetical protein
MKLFKRLLVHAIALLALNCCLADSGPTKLTVSVNDHVLQITLPGEGAAPSVVQRLIAERVRRAIIDLTVQKSNITVSQETLSRCMDLYVVAGGESPTNIVDVVAARSAITIEALRKVVVNHEDKNDVYDKYLSRVMPHSEWETWLSSNNSIGKIDKLESLVPHSVNDLKRFSQESLRRDIEVWLLFHKLTKEVKPSPEEIQSYYKEKYPAGTPSFSEVKSEIENEAAKQTRDVYLNKWWQKQLAGSKIEVPAEYQNVSELIKITPNTPFLPVSITAILEKIN